ncbi:MAG: type IV fimbrial biogenesis protein FimT [Candidatus Azotimanducaceae bacterium]|jgi:type IV fimbrial biogenesis protein FimT
MKSSGVTLIELLSGLAIILVMFSLAIPSFNKIHSRSVATAGINWIVGAVNFTRHAAITHQITTTLCPSPIDQTDCHGKWHDGVIVFADFNADAIVNGNDFLIRRIHSDNFSGTIKWRAFRNRQYLQMTQNGHTNFQNGNFVYCPSNQNLHFARQIVINMQGRTRVVNSQNNDGKRIDRRGKLLRC